jgi:hypothetical protein
MWCLPKWQHVTKATLTNSQAPITAIRETSRRLAGRAADASTLVTDRDCPPVTYCTASGWPWPPIINVSFRNSAQQQEYKETHAQPTPATDSPPSPQKGPRRSILGLVKGGVGELSGPTFPDPPTTMKQVLYTHGTSRKNTNCPFIYLVVNGWLKHEDI